MAQDQHKSKLHFDAEKPDAAEVVRRAILARLRAGPDFGLATPGTESWDDVELVRERDRARFWQLVQDVTWELVIEGILAPGHASGHPSRTGATFHVTHHGRRILDEPDYQPHDPADYLRQLGISVPAPDATVLAYLREALACYSRGLMVASTMMLGIAAERVFLLVCDSLAAALKDPAERAAFQKILDRNPMKPKLDWVSDKLREIQTPKRPPDLPEDVDIKIPGIFNLIRCQRNDVGHPRPAPPAVTQDDAYGYLRLFPSYYATAEAVRAFLAKNKV